MSGKLLFGLVIAAVLILVGLQSLFIVEQRQYALLLQFGEIKGADFKPGLHVKVPFINNVIKLDKRLQTTDASPERFLTAEKKFVVVDSFVKWRISDPAQFYRSTGGGDKANASRLLAQRINTALRDEFGKRTVQEVVSGKRTEIMQTLTRKADEKSSDLGIEVVDVRVKKIDFPERVSASVYDRMRTERLRVAKELRAEGAEAAEKIRANADRKRIEIVSEAYREAETIRGDGDAKSAETYAKAFDKDAEFYAFWRSLKAYRRVFATRDGSIMVLDPDSEFFRYFKGRAGGTK